MGGAGRRESQWVRRRQQPVRLPANFLDVIVARMKKPAKGSFMGVHGDWCGPPWRAVSRALRAPSSDSASTGGGYAL